MGAQSPVVHQPLRGSMGVEALQFQNLATRSRHFTVGRNSYKRRLSSRCFDGQLVPARYLCARTLEQRQRQTFILVSCFQCDNRRDRHLTKRKNNTFTLQTRFFFIIADCSAKAFSRVLIPDVLDFNHASLC